MRSIQSSLFLFAVFVNASSAAAEVSLEEIWSIVQQQQIQIAALTDKLEATQAKLDSTQSQAKITEEQLGLTVDYLAEVETAVSANRTNLGGYGELHYNNLNADDDSRDFKEADFHRFVLFFGHQFTDRIRFNSEFEIEHSLVKDTADGSNGGEVEIEQAYLEMDLNDNHWARAGLALIPVGITNETHEPPTFYGVERNDVENIIIPATWWEAGVAGGGHYGNGLSWEFGVHSGLEMATDGGSAFRIRSGRQKVSHANAENLAYTLRLKYTGVPGLELAGTYQHQTDASQLSGDGLGSADLFSMQGIWNKGPFSLRALWAQWNFAGDSVELAGVDQQTGWYIEPSVRLDLGGTDWGFYGRFEDLDGARTRDRFEQWELGFNFWPTESVVLKFDYRNRDHLLNSDAGRDFHAIDLGIGYQF
ncbi:MAG: porin [Pseudomonadales bacterium]|jgi:hypothetical protein